MAGESPGPDEYDRPRSGMKHTRRRALGWLAVLAVLVPSGCRSGGAAAPGEADASARAGRRLPPGGFEVLVWRAGRAIPPGLTAGREAELERERADARAELRPELDRGRGRDRLRRLLEDGGAPDETWCCAARAAGACEQYELAAALVAGLEGAFGARVQAACEGLHALYGRWFTEPSEVTPYLEQVRGGAGTRLLLETSAWEEARSRERLLAGLADRPSAASAWLADPDPSIRAGAARLSGELFSRESTDANAVLGLLIVHLEREAEPHAFHEALQALLPALERVDPEHASLCRLREVLAGIADQPGDPRTLPAAGALARLPWRKDGARDAPHVLSGVELLGAMLGGLADADRGRGANDPDSMVAVFGALRGLCDQASAGGLTAELRTSRARESVFEVLRDTEQDDAARASAAAALGALALPSDALVLASVLGDPSASAAVKHSLLGSLRSILTEFRPGDPAAQELLDAVAALSCAEDADLRRRALSLLAEPRLESLVRQLDPSFLAERLAAETSPEIASQLLRLIERFGRAELLGTLLSMERFDVLAADPARLEELALALRALTEGAPRAAMAAATRLSSVRSPTSGLSCLRAALALVAPLDETASFELYPSEQRTICAWVWEIYLAGVPLRDAVPQGLAFERRLLDVHLPRSEKASSADREGQGFGPFERAHLVALVRADLVLAGIGRATRPQVESAFEAAYELAPGGGFQHLVLRDRARFRAAAGECVKALADYRRLLEVAENDELLGIPDLRTAVDLLARVGGNGAAPGGASAGGGAGVLASASSAEACDLLERIVRRRSWRAEPASVRMEDLRNLVQAALDSRDHGRLQLLETALADLPLTQLELGNEVDPPPVWYGLLRDPAWFQELLDLRARVRIELRELQAQG